MSQNAIEYLKQFRDRYSKEVLAEQLRQSGYDPVDIVESVNAVYGSGTLSLVQATPQVTQPHYAGFWIRFVAIMIDGMIIWMANMVLILPMSLVISSMGDELLGGLLGVGTALFAVAISFGYFIFLTYRYQTTLGKMALGLRVYAENLQRPTLGQVLGREFGRILSHIVLYVGYIMAGFTPKKQALHDILAKTVVVYKDSVQ
ncbi:RDD family protein [Patescibacteria group bacterium]|nr:MAG: RDD family protein [Patescibacteria group bacterium]